MARGRRLGEFELIARYFRPLAHPDYGLDLADDAAAMSFDPPGELVLTADTLIAGVHFFADDPASLIARKALRVNLSDLAAKGAEPVGYLMSIGLPYDWNESWIEAFCGGLSRDQQEYGAALLGGDTVCSPERMVISITAIGRSGERGMVRRSGGETGDIVFVTGTIGDGALGLKLRRDQSLARTWKLDAQHKRFLEERYLLPQPRLSAIPALRGHANAAMDVSDGLIGDLRKLAAASGVGVRLDMSAIPVSEAAGKAVAASPALMKTLVGGGDDYEILALVPPARSANFVAALEAIELPVREIGRCDGALEAGSLVDGSGKTIDPDGDSFTHF